MSLDKYGRVVLILGLAFAPTACSEQGLLPDSPVAPSSQAGAAAKPGGGSTGFPVTTTVADGGSLHIQSDGGGPYVNSKTLKSQVEESGDWLFDTLTINRATRKISLQFSPIAGTDPDDPDPVPANGLYKFRAMMHCQHYGIRLQDITPAEPGACPVSITFDVGSERHRFIMAPTGTGGIHGPWPTTDDVAVTCTATSGSTCSQWLVTPSNPSGTNVARLVEVDGFGAIVADHGDFNLSFSIVIAR